MEIMGEITADFCRSEQECYKRMLSHCLVRCSVTARVEAHPCCAVILDPEEFPVLDKASFASEVDCVVEELKERGFKVEQILQEGNDSYCEILIRW
jgi:hypothetical protein